MTIWDVSTEEGSLASRLGTVVWSTMTLSVGLAVVVGGLLYIKQESLLYLPEIGGIPRRPEDNPRRYRSPGENGVPFTSHMIECDDGVLIHAWLLDRSQPLKPTLVFFHGNAGNIGLRLPNAIQMYQYLDANILMVEYRGYGDSQSVKPTEKGLKLDAEAALKFLVYEKNVDPTTIFLFGRSLGGAVAFHLADFAQKNKIPLAGVIVENTFLSIAAMVDHLMPVVAPLKGLVLRMGWKSIEIVPNLKLPILYLAGAVDELVPHKHMQHLHNISKASRLLQMLIIPDGTHNETWLQGGQEYWTKMRTFMTEASALVAASKDEVCATKHQSHDLGLNTDKGQENDVDSSTKSIPTMSSNLFGMLGDAMGSASSNNDNAYDSVTKKEI